jgi:hypothetical protein
MQTRQILIVLVLGLFAAAHAGDAELSAEERQRLEAGEILTWTAPVAGRSVPSTKAVGVVDAPPAAVWPIIDECARYEDTMPSTLDSEELERQGDHVRCRGVGDLPFPFSDLPTETDAIHTVEPGKLYRREWKQRSGDFNANEGRWTLVPWGDGSKTLATYEAMTEPKMAMPDFILRWATESVLPEMIATLREHAKARTAPSSP